MIDRKMKLYISKAKKICSDLEFPFESAIIEFVYELENKRITFLRPTKKQITKWLKQRNGLDLFIKYLEKKTNRPWSTNIALKLWEIYQSEIKVVDRITNRQELIDKELRKNAKLNCKHCGKKIAKKDAEIDHLIPVSLGGSSERRNLIILCKKCNRRKSNKYWLIL